MSIIESIKEISVYYRVYQSVFLHSFRLHAVRMCCTNRVSVSRPQNSGSDSDHDSDSPPPSPMRPFRPRVRVQAGPAGGSGVQEALAPHAPGPSLAPEPTPAGPHVFAREEYHSVIRGLGSARALHQGALHKGGALHQGTQSPLTSTPALSSNSRPALVPEEEDLADDWLDDDLGEVVQARKKRRVGEEQSGPSGEGGAWSGEGGAWTTLTTRGQHRQENGGVSQSK